MMQKHHKIGFIAGIVVFFVNIAENIIHYNIGKQSERGEQDAEFYIPSSEEFGKMILTSIVAGLVVGSVTKRISNGS